MEAYFSPRKKPRIKASEYHHTATGPNLKISGPTSHVIIYAPLFLLIGHLKYCLRLIAISQLRLYATSFFR